MDAIRMPPRAEGTVEEQIADIRDYLQILNRRYITRGDTSVAVVRDIYNSLRADIGYNETVESAGTLRDLIIKTAGEIVRNDQELSISLNGNYVAKSEFGEYKTETSAQINANSQGIEQLYDFHGEITNELDRITTTSNYRIVTGLLYYDGATPVYGVGVGNLKTTTKDGHKVIDTNNLLGTFTADELAFWNGGTKVLSLTADGLKTSGEVIATKGNIGGCLIENGVLKVGAGNLSFSALTGTVVEYATSTSNTTAPTSGWSSTSPQWEEGKYVWQRTALTSTTGTTYSQAVCISGAKGSNGKDGTSVTIKGTLTSTSLLPTSGAVSGDGYIIDGDLWVYTGSTISGSVRGFTNVGKVQGPQGEQGIPGRDGADGAKGDKGDTGATGAKGDTGAQGPQGIQGVQGIQGEKGDTGAKGDKGDKGDTGATGPKGDKGDPGADGKDGTNGSDGISVASFEVQYAEVPTGGSSSTATWGTNIPEYRAGYLIYERVKTTYSNGTITYAPSRYGIVSTNVNKFGSQIDINTNAITLANSAIATANERIDSAESDIDGLGTEMASQQSSITAMQSQLTVQAGQIASKVSQTTWDTTIPSLETEIGGKVDTSTYTAAITEMNSAIEQNATNISLKVSQSDYNGATIASLIDQTADTVKISAKHIKLIGEIDLGGWSIGQNSLYTNKGIGVYLTGNGDYTANTSSPIGKAVNNLFFRAGNNAGNAVFGIGTDGKIYATAGYIGNMEITNHGLEYNLGTQGDLGYKHIEFTNGALEYNFGYSSFKVFEDGDHVSLDMMIADFMGTPTAGLYITESAGDVYGKLGGKWYIGGSGTKDTPNYRKSITVDYNSTHEVTLGRQIYVEGYGTLADIIGRIENLENILGV